MGHVLVSVKVRGKKSTELKEALVDTSASFTVFPLELAEEYLIDTPFEVELRLGDGRRVRAKVFIGELEIEAGESPSGYWPSRGQSP